MKTTAIAAVSVAVVVLAASGAYFVAQQRAAEQMDAAIANVRASLPPGTSFTYGSAAPELFNRRGHFTDVAMVSGDETLHAATLDVSPGENRTLRHLDATAVTARTPGAQASADRFDADGLSLPVAAPALAGIDPAAIAFDHAGLHGLHLVPKDGGIVDAVALTVDGYGAGRPTTIDLAGLQARVEGGVVDTVGLEHVRLRGLLLADVVARARSGAGNWPRSLDYALDLTKLAMTAGGKPFLSLAALTTGSDPKGADRFETRFDMTDLLVVSTPGLTSGLTELGYDRFQGGMQMHATVDRAAQQMRMDRLDLDAPAMGQLHLALGLDNVPYDTLTPASGQMDAGAFLAMLQARLQSAELRYEDHSFADKVFAAAAAKQNTTPAAVKQTNIAMLNATGAQLHLGRSVLDPVAAFLQDPHRLVVAIKPPQPIALMNLSGVAADPQRRLGLTVTN